MLKKYETSLTPLLESKQQPALRAIDEGLQIQQETWLHLFNPN